MRSKLKMSKRLAPRKGKTTMPLKAVPHVSPLTPKDELVLSFIKSFEMKEGIPPSREEITKALGFPHLMTAQRSVEKLRDHGVLKFQKNSKRGLEILDVAVSGDDIVELPLLGKVAAGHPIEAIEQSESLKVPAHMIKGNYPHFALRVTGNSMVDDHIEDGDYVIVRQQHAAENGETVVALIDGEATLKRYHRMRDRVELHPANEEFSPIVVGAHQHLRILGVYVGLIRMK